MRSMDTNNGEGTMKAKSHKQYVEAWDAHIRSLIHPALDAELPFKEWEELERDLKVMIRKAADNVFKNGGPAY